jgi:hypothetical protein
MKKSFIILLLASINLFCQEYEIAWQKDIGGTYAQFSKDGQYIYVAKGNEIWKYNSADGEFFSKFDNSGFKVNGSAFYGNFYLSNSGNYLIGVCGQYYNVWDTKKEIAFFQFDNIFGGLDITNDDSKYLAVKRITPDNDRITLIDLNSQKEIKSITSNQNIILTKLSHNGKMFATASISGSKYYLTLWDTETLSEIKRFELLGSTISTTLWEIKFSWDDKLLSIRRSTPNEVSIYDTEKLILYTKSNFYKNNEISNNEFTGDNKYIIFYYPNYDIPEYNFLILERNSLQTIQIFTFISYPIITSSNNLIFTGKALIKPKTVDVSEPIQQNSERSISPNPARDYIEINVGAGSKPAQENDMQIFNIFGEKITTPSNLSGSTPLLAKEGNFKIDVSLLSTGIYFIKIGDKFEKFIKW